MTCLRCYCFQGTTLGCTWRYLALSSLLLCTPLLQPVSSSILPPLYIRHHRSEITTSPHTGVIYEVKSYGGTALTINYYVEGMPRVRLLCLTSRVSGPIGIVFNSPGLQSFDGKRVNYTTALWGTQVSLAPSFYWTNSRDLPDTFNFHNISTVPM